MPNTTVFKVKNIFTVASRLSKIFCMKDDYLKRYQAFFTHFIQARLNSGLSQVEEANRLEENQLYVEQCKASIH